MDLKSLSSPGQCLCLIFQFPVHVVERECSCEWAEGEAMQRTDQVELRVCRHRWCESYGLFSSAPATRATRGCKRCRGKLGWLLGKAELVLHFVLFGKLFNL